MELGFAALASLAQTWDTAEPEDEEDGKKLHIWKAGCVQLADTFSALLQRAWLTSIQVYPLSRTEIRWNGLARHRIFESYNSQWHSEGTCPDLVIFASVT